jgi:hypothetical protein
MQIRRKAALYGNMTGVEKQMNKDEMLAYKNYETHTTSLIPGLNSSVQTPTERVMHDKMVKGPSTRTLQTDVDRLNKFGMMHDFTKKHERKVDHLNAHG